MKQRNPVLDKQPEFIREYNILLNRSGLSHKDLTDALGVRYECVLGRRKGKQTITTEALLALRMVVLGNEADRLVAKAKAATGVDPLEGIY